MSSVVGLRPPSAPFRPPGRIWERFEILERVGAGASGQVFKALDRRSGSTVALKTLYRSDPKAIRGMRREFEAVAGLRHRNLVRLYELLTDDDRPFFTMELVDGRSFLDHVRPRRSDGKRALAVDRLRAALVQLGRGLDALHGAGRLHCDLKPSNLLVDATGRVVLLDFGLARRLENPHDDSLFGLFCGTPAYMSPEQAIGKAMGRASDWYSVGAMLYEALTGRLPFEGGLLEILTRKQDDEPPRPESLAPDVPRDLSELAMRLLRRAPASRQPSRERAPDGNDLAVSML